MRQWLSACAWCVGVAKHRTEGVQIVPLVIKSTAARAASIRLIIHVHDTRQFAINSKLTQTV